MTEGYFIEWNGDCWQSVFPSNEAEKSQLHVSVADAIDYMTDACGVDPEVIETRPKYPNGAPMFASDGTMLDEKGNRSIFDDVDQ